MVDNKIKYLNVNIPKMENELNFMIKESKHLLRIEKEIVNKINEISSAGDLNEVEEKINEKFQEKGETLKILKLLTNAENDKTKYSNKIDQLKIEFDKSIENLDSVLDELNDIASQVSNILYAENHYIEYETKSDHIVFKIDSLQTKVGSGKKKGQIVIFDFAYNNFMKFKGLPFPQFILHDLLEVVDLNQVKNIFNYANSNLDGQYIVPILRDRIEEQFSEEFIEENKILELSQDDKFFKIP